MSSKSPETAMAVPRVEDASASASTRICCWVQEVPPEPKVYTAPLVPVTLLVLYGAPTAMVAPASATDAPN